MHGVILYSLGKFVRERYGDAAWDRLRAMAGQSDIQYLPSRIYPDEQALALVGAAEQLTGQPANAILDAFGDYVAPALLAMYDAVLDPDWRTLEVIEHIERTIHDEVRRRAPDASPPHLRCTRSGPDTVTVVYSSSRKMCHVATGIARGLARHFGEKVEISQPQCMHHGARECHILVRRLTGATTH